MMWSVSFRRRWTWRALLLECVGLLLCLASCGSQDPLLLEGTESEQLLTRSPSGRNLWFRQWLARRAGKYEAAASLEEASLVELNHLTHLDRWLLAWKLERDQGQQPEIGSLDPDKWAQNYDCYLSQAQAVLRQMQEKNVIDNSLHYSQLQEEWRQCVNSTSNTGKDLQDLQREIDSNSHSLRTWKRIWASRLRKQPKEEEDMIDASEQKARSMVRSLDAAVQQQSQLLAVRKAAKRASDLRCGMMEWRQGIRARSAFQESEVLTRAQQQLSSLGEEVQEAREALRRLNANATALLCSSSEWDSASSGSLLASHNTQVDDHRYFLLFSLEFMQSALHRASDLGYSTLGKSVRECERIHLQLHSDRNKLIVAGDDVVELDNAVARKRREVERLRQRADAFKQAEVEAQAKAQALAARVGSAGIDEAQQQWCHEAIAQMRTQEHDARRGKLQTSALLTAPEQELAALSLARERTAAETRAMREEVKAVEAAVGECDAGVAELRRRIGVLAKHSGTLRAVRDSLRGEGGYAVE